MSGARILLVMLANFATMFWIPACAHSERRQRRSRRSPPGLDLRKEKREREREFPRKGFVRV